jgi:hypothetical protein
LATGVTAGGEGGVAVGVVLVVVGEVAVGGEFVGVEPGFETLRECLGGLFAFASPIEEAALSLVAWPVTLVSTLATPDEYEPEACFDELDCFEMDGCAPKNDPSGTSSGFGVAVLGLADGRGGSEERTCGAATAQIASTSAASVANAARTKKSDRLPQTGLMYFILIRKRLQHYTSIEGGHSF